MSLAVSEPKAEQFGRKSQYYLISVTIGTTNRIAENTHNNLTIVEAASRDYPTKTAIVGFWRRLGNFRHSVFRVGQHPAEGLTCRVGGLADDPRAYYKNLHKMQ